MRKSHFRIKLFYVLTELILLMIFVILDEAGKITEFSYLENLILATLSCISTTIFFILYSRYKETQISGKQLLLSYIFPFFKKKVGVDKNNIISLNLLTYPKWD